MIEVNSSAIVLGFAVGLPLSVLFFWGLNWGMRLALASEHPGRLLLLSFLCRLVLLLTVGFGLSTLTATLWSLAGYMLAFLLVRVVTVMRAQVPRNATLPKQEGV
ncbi:ATP synthase subunit I [Denitrificimonas caeni]|uniref:N-ATPase subunit AtpR n=1 Tax=Denitrificimonas caeni TaxID=521720 RepID=UPI0019629BBC|nr:ATP synthase subunit I [Denitrificimonas caeni]